MDTETKRRPGHGLALGTPDEQAGSTLGTEFGVLVVLKTTPLASFPRNQSSLAVSAAAFAEARTDGDSSTTLGTMFD